MDFVEKEKILRVERCENRREVAFFLEQRSRADFYGRAHFVGQNLRERGFAKARRAVEQNVVERFATGARRLDGDLQILFDAILADVIGQLRRADAGFDARVVIERPARNDAIVRIVYFLGHLSATQCSSKTPTCSSVSVN